MQKFKTVSQLFFFLLLSPVLSGQELDTWRIGADIEPTQGSFGLDVNEDGVEDLVHI